jgi:Fe2+ transport system protein FeoA
MPQAGRRSLAARVAMACTRDMPKSERVAQEWTLATIEPGLLVDVVDVDGSLSESLLVHGVRPGARLAIEGDAPFGGPRIVRLGGSRVAIDRRLAATVRVVRAAGNGAPIGDPDGER